MLRMLRLWFWAMVPHCHEWTGFATKYGCSAFCRRCGKSVTMMDGFPYGD
jgi:hypothetical protein